MNARCSLTAALALQDKTHADITDCQAALDMADCDAAEAERLLHRAAVWRQLGVIGMPPASRQVTGLAAQIDQQIASDRDKAEAWAEKCRRASEGGRRREDQR